MQLAPATQLLQAEPGNRGRAENQHQGLRRIGIQHGAQAAGDGVKPGEQDGNHSADPERCVGTAECIRQQGAEDDRAGINGDRYLGQHVGGEGHQRKNPARLWPEAPLEKLRHGENAGLVVKRNKNPGEQHHNPGVQLIVRHGEPVEAPCPARPTMCSEPMFEAKMEAPMAKNPTLRPARK